MGKYPGAPGGIGMAPIRRRHEEPIADCNRGPEYGSGGVIGHVEQPSGPGGTEKAFAESGRQA